MSFARIRLIFQSAGGFSRLDLLATLTALALIAAIAYPQVGFSLTQETSQVCSNVRVIRP